MGKTTTYNYDSVTKLLKYIQNANNVRTAYTYDNRDRTSKIYLDSDKDGIPDTAEPQVAYLYANNRLSGIDTATTDYTLTYDIWGNVLSIKAGNYTLATYEYAANNGKLKKLTYGNGDCEEYVYDELERLVQTKLNGVTEYTVKYDANGRLYSLTENGVTHIYEYDSLDRLVRAWQEDENGNITVAVENSYDDLGRAKGSTYVVDDRTMSYEVNYKANSNLVNHVLMPTAGLQSSISYTYDEFERVTKKQNSFSSALNFYEQYGYYSYTDAEGEQHATSLVSTVTFGGNTPHTPSAVYSYTYDNLGNITQIRKNGVIINEYTYDSLGQLTCEEDAVAGKTYIYYYDKSGNITKKDSYPFAEGATMGDYISYIASQRQTVATYTYGNATWGDLLTNYNGTAITYDAIGNPLKWRNAVGLTWDARQLQRVDLSTNSYVNYTYNSDGIRTSRSYVNFNTQYSEERNYILDGNKIIQEDITISTITALTNATLYYLYDVSGEVQGFIYNNSYYYFQKNLQGDVVRILNSSGSVVVEYTYDAWGKVLTTTGSLASTVGKYNPFRYRSYYYDTETGFYYLQSRYYDPTVGRFLNSDGIIGANGGIEGYNMFAYCNNNPVMYADETGYYATQNFLLAANLSNKWYEMIITHFWGAVHRAVQMDIVSNNYGVYPEVAANNGRMDLYSPFDHEVWEIKHCSDNGNGLVSARKSLSKYLDAYGEGNPHKGAAGAFSGIISGCNLGDKFQYLYNITYVTPESGVVLYSFTVGIKKQESYAYEKEKVYAYARKTKRERMASEVVYPSSAMVNTGGLIGVAAAGSILFISSLNALTKNCLE